MQQNVLLRPATRFYNLKSNEEQLGVIVNARCLGQEEDAPGVLQLGLQLLPDGEKHSHYHLDYDIPIDWDEDSELVQALASLDALPPEGGWQALDGLIGTAIMVSIQVVESDDEGSEYFIQDIRIATEEEAARTDWDDEDDSLDPTEFGEELDSSMRVDKLEQEEAPAQPVSRIYCSSLKGPKRNISFSDWDALL